MSGIFLAPNEYCCAENELILQMSSIKCFLASTHRIWNLRNSWFLSLLQKKCSSIRRRGLKKRGRFSRKRRRFSRKRGRFSWKRWSFFLNNGTLFLSDGRLSNGHGTFRYNTLPRKPLLWKAWQGSTKVPLKSVTPSLSRGRAHAHYRSLCLFAFTTFTDFRITLFVSSRNKHFSDIF